MRQPPFLLPSSSLERPPDQRARLLQVEHRRNPDLQVTRPQVPDAAHIAREALLQCDRVRVEREVGEDHSVRRTQEGPGTVRGPWVSM